MSTSSFTHIFPYTLQANTGYFSGPVYMSNGLSVTGGATVDILYAGTGYITNFVVETIITDNVVATGYILAPSGIFTNLSASGYVETTGNLYVSGNSIFTGPSTFQTINVSTGSATSPSISFPNGDGLFITGTSLAISAQDITVMSWGNGTGMSRMFGSTNNGVKLLWQDETVIPSGVSASPLCHVSFGATGHVYVDVNSLANYSDGTFRRLIGGYDLFYANTGSVSSVKLFSTFESVPFYTSVNTGGSWYLYINQTGTSASASTSLTINGPSADVASITSITIS